MHWQEVWNQSNLSRHGRLLCFWGDRWLIRKIVSLNLCQNSFHLNSAVAMEQSTLPAVCQGWLISLCLCKPDDCKYLNLNQCMRGWLQGSSVSYGGKQVNSTDIIYSPLLFQTIVFLFFTVVLCRLCLMMMMVLHKNIKQHNFNSSIIRNEATNQHIGKISEGSRDTEMSLQNSQKSLKL